MKKIVTLFAFAFVAFTANAQSNLKGDMNDDGEKNITDVMLLVDEILNGSKPQAYLTCPDDHHPHMIDLGLPSGTKWACCNEGASKPEDFGGYYKFGEVSSAPSLNQIEELVNNCYYSWTTQNGVKGGRFTGPSGGSIFLPAAGYGWYGELDYVGSYGDYWSSTSDDGGNAYSLYFNPYDASWGNDWGSYRSSELSVRPVR